MRKKTSFFIAIAAMMITSAAVWYGYRPFTLEKSSWEDVMAEAKSGGYRIITTEELRDHHQTASSSLLLVDTRQEWEYRSGHIKGAMNFPMEPTWWARWRKADELEAFLGKDKQRDIVFY